MLKVYQARDWLYSHVFTNSRYQQRSLDLIFSTSLQFDWLVLGPLDAKISLWRLLSRLLTGRPLVMMLHVGAYWRPTTGLDGPRQANASPAAPTLPSHHHTWWLTMFYTDPIPALPPRHFWKHNVPLARTRFDDTTASTCRSAQGDCTLHLRLD